MLFSFFKTLIEYRRYYVCQDITTTRQRSPMCIFVCISINSMRFYSKESGNDAYWMGILTIVFFCFSIVFSAISVSKLSDDWFFCVGRRATKCTFEQWLSWGFKKKISNWWHCNETKSISSISRKCKHCICLGAFYSVCFFASNFHWIFFL